LPGKDEVTGDDAGACGDQHEPAKDGGMALSTFGEEQHRDNDPAEHANGGPTELLDPELLDRQRASGVVQPPTCRDGAPHCTFDRAGARPHDWSKEPLQSWKRRYRWRLGYQSRRSGRIPQIRPDPIFESVPSQEWNP
jgi:hypothetical protein